ncbi:MAG: hypothetical protein RDU59_04875 [Thermodesulfobacteriota bacterium]|nr:hypothetical protein [Thermodesulfobacteriota bacterium]
MVTDISEKGLESLIITALTRLSPSVAKTGDVVAAVDPAIPYGGADYVQGDPRDYDPDHAVDLVKLLAFVKATQPKAFAQLELGADGPPRLKFLARLQGEIAKRGVVDVLRKGIQHHSATVDLFYGTPSPGNAKAAERFAANWAILTSMDRVA